MAVCNDCKIDLKEVSFIMPTPKELLNVSWDLRNFERPPLCESCWQKRYREMYPEKEE